jgi:hypothetical protein
MKQLMTGLLVLALLLFGGVPWAMADQIELKQSDGTITKLGGVGDAAKVTKATTDAGEDVANDVMKVEQRFAPINVSADTLVKSGPGQLHLITCSSDATATAGSIILYDNTAESGTVLHTFTVAAAYYQPFTIWFDVAFSIGLYVGYTTTADVNCTVSYR